MWDLEKVVRPIPATLTNQRTHPWQTQTPNSWPILSRPTFCHLRTEQTLFKKKKKACIFNLRNKGSQAIKNRCQEFARNNHHTCCRSSGSTESLGPVFPEMLFQLRNGRQQLLALMTAQGQLQELRHTISDSHSARLLYHLDHSCKQGKTVQSLAALESQYKEKEKSDPK